MSEIQQAKKLKKKKSVYLPQKKHVMAALAPKLDKDMVALSEQTKQSTRVDTPKQTEKLLRSSKVFQLSFLD